MRITTGLEVVKENLLKNEMGVGYVQNAIDYILHLEKELGINQDTTETINTSELQDFMQFMNTNLDLFKDSSQARKTIYAIIRLYDEYKKER